MCVSTGIDLVAQVIPVVCARYPNVHFIVGGDGNKKLLLEEMRVRRSGGPQHRQTGAYVVVCGVVVGLRRSTSCMTAWSCWEGCRTPR